MKRRIISLLLALVMVCSAAPYSMAATDKMANFKRSNQYKGQFTDVSSGSWYASSVQGAFEYGLVKGNSAATYNPAGSITIAETIALAARICSIYQGGTGQFVQGSPWYQVYVDFAQKAGIISGTYDYKAMATRAQFAKIIGSSMPPNALPVKNQIADNAIPDVKITDPYGPAVYRLYRAGILSGSDKAGTFNPDSNIQRSEVAAILVRMVEPASRVSVVITVPAAGVLVDPKSHTLYVGQTVTAGASVQPVYASDKRVTWSSSDPSIATVSQNGLVTAVKPGIAYITATTVNGKTQSCKITVKANPTPYDPKTYKTYMESDIMSLNFWDNSDANAETVAMYSQSYLWRQYPKANGNGYLWLPDLAAGEPVKVNNYTWKIPLRKGATFQDGTAITADTWIYTFQQLLDPDLQLDMAVFLADNQITIANAEYYYYGWCNWSQVGIKKLDAYTLQITTSEPCTDADKLKSHFGYRCLTPMHPKKWAANLQGGYSTYGWDLNRYVGSGPYVMTQRKYGEMQVYIKNHSHWLASYYPYDRIEVRIVPDKAQQVALFKAGQIYSLELSGEMAELYADDHRYVTAGTNEVRHIDINNGTSPVKNYGNPIAGTVAWRKAIYHAIDRENLVKECFYDQKPVGWYINDQAGQFSPSGLTYRQSTWGQKVEKTVAGWSVPGHTTGYNPTLANQYLKQAYAEKGLSANTRITCILLVDYYDYQWSDAAYWLEDQLEQVFGGLVDVRIQWFYNDVRTAKQIYAWDLSPNLWTRSLSRTYPHQSMYYYISAYEGHPNTFTSARFDAQFARCEQLKNGSYDTLLAETYQLEMIYLEQVIHCPVSQTSRCWLMNENIPLRAKTYIPGFGWGEIFGKGTN